MERQEFTADVADLVLSIARKIAATDVVAPDIVALSNVESLVMRHIDRNPGISPSRIADQLGLRTANVSAILRQLEQKRLVRRAHADADRRAVEVHPTAVASRNLSRLREEWAARLDDVVPTVDQAAGEAVLGFLKGLDAGFDGARTR